MNKISFKQMLWLITYILVLVMLVTHLDRVIDALQQGVSIVSPFIVGGCLAFVMSIPVNFFERTIFSFHNRPKLQKLKRAFSFLLTLLLMGLVVFVVIFLLVPELGNTFQLIADNIPAFLLQTYAWVQTWPVDWVALESWLLDLQLDYQSLLDKAMAVVQTSLSGMLSSTVVVVSTVAQGIFNAVITFIFSAYLVFSKEKIKRQGVRLLYAMMSEEKADGAVGLFRLTHHTFSKFLTGQCLEAVILGTLFYIAMSIFGMPYSLLISVLIAVLALIPIFGAFIGCIVGAFLILMVDPMQAFWFIIMFLIIQQIEGNFIYPHVVGGSIGLPALWVLVAVTVGGGLYGIAGMLLFIPLFSVVYVVLGNVIQRRLTIKQVEITKWGDTPIVKKPLKKPETK